ncbi:MAG: hypothetical protein ICV78_24465 [Tolypothrix sp. Co-bin9]|nr:hypothetical protein [Tolypothrix sp. Co-bin9]
MAATKSAIALGTHKVKKNEQPSPKGRRCAKTLAQRDKSIVRYQNLSRIWRKKSFLRL